MTETSCIPTPFDEIQERNRTMTEKLGNEGKMDAEEIQSFIELALEKSRLISNIVERSVLRVHLRTWASRLARLTGGDYPDIDIDTPERRPAELTT